MAWIDGILSASSSYATPLPSSSACKSTSLARDLAGQLLFFIGIMLNFEAFHVEIELGIFWLPTGIIAVLGASLVYRDDHQRVICTRENDRFLERLQKG